MPRFDTLIFDLDGTLIDSAPAILASFRQAFDATGIVPVRPITADIIGPPLNETLGLLSGRDDDATLGLLTDAFKQAYDGGGLRETTAYAGVTAMLEALHGRGVRLHIATNKRLHPTRCILELLGWSHLFDTVYALDMVEPRLPTKAAMIARQLDEQHIDPHRAAYVGDRREDGDAAQANRLPFFAATWGYGALTPDALEPGWQHLPTPDAERLLSA
ncbi:HAD hydrolase-like protein [Nitrogeniibacter mangrovi]|uniref:HAD hydrolase-like protein n=1 Tax=Nitrogeniibacter mangrovi TaxID=2016596 RepID=A0A6C1B188_9RHOO|nr:HAD hydrolase-like protein [Nitrogeniibacter mangrovi]QID17337.1 HAD hydrolase-like protein [Nitrogeniibacter mangrovi]